jgi:hypothetical protein
LEVGWTPGSAEANRTYPEPSGNPSAHEIRTASSWMNLVERFFRDLTELITEKGFASTRELADAIIAFLAERNKNPRRYVWKAKRRRHLA